MPSSARKPRSVSLRTTQFMVELAAKVLLCEQRRAAKRAQKPRYVALERVPLYRPARLTRDTVVREFGPETVVKGGDPIFRWVKGEKGERVKLPVNHVTVTTLNHGKRYSNKVLSKAERRERDDYYAFLKADALARQAGINLDGSLRRETIVSEAA